MDKPKLTYIALGSNQGNRIEFLQKAVNAVFEKVGRILKVSAVYETPALGFEGEDFLNACIKIETRFGPQTVLEKLLDIETELGRTRIGDTYQNRTLDLDVLFYEQESIHTESLKIPHPRLHQRLFVLKPLADIAGDWVHPELNQTVSELLTICPDTSEIKLTQHRLNIPDFQFAPISYLAIEGNIGAGKTSLTQMISQDFNAKLIMERFKDNPFLPKFYENPARYAFPLEMSFLADRYRQLLDDIKQFDLFRDFVVADYDVYKSMIFAGVTLPEEEFALYKQLFNIMYKDLPKPDLYVFLHQNTERLLQNIKKRGREYEQNIRANYLNKINEAYLSFIKTQQHLPALIIDVSNLDFVSRREDYLYLLRNIIQAVEHKKTGG